MGILVCGLNGAGKTTFGRALAEKINYRFIDIEDLYFPDGCDYANPRSSDEARSALLDLIHDCGGKFVLTSVRANFCTGLEQHFTLVVVVRAGRDERLARVRARSAEKFGERILPGGDMYGVESKFFRMVESRDEDYAEAHLQNLLENGKLSCPVVKINGSGSSETLRQSVEENVKLVVRRMEELNLL